MVRFIQDPFYGSCHANVRLDKRYTHLHCFHKEIQSQVSVLTLTQPKEREKNIKSFIFKYIFPFVSCLASDSWCCSLFFIRRQSIWQKSLGGSNLLMGSTHSIKQTNGKQSIGRRIATNFFIKVKIKFVLCWECVCNSKRKTTSKRVSNS